MPLCYALQDLFGLVGVTWIDPTLILGLAVFLLMGRPVREKAPLWVLAFAFLSAAIGASLLHASPDRDRAALYTYFVEPIRLTLNIIWFWVSLRFLRLDRKFVLRCLTFTVAWEFLLSCYLYAAFYDLVPVPDSVKLYLAIYKSRQALSWGDWEVYRMAGTFLESPPFGLFMFCCLVILVLTLSERDRNSDGRFRVLLVCGAVCAFLGTIASLSDQMLIALIAFGFTFLLARTGRVGTGSRLLAAALAIALVLYVGNALLSKSKVESAYTGDPMGSSIGERTFHARYGLSLLAEQPASIVTGIGPGRYGDYAVRTGFFPSTVTAQFTAVEWLVEYGLLGVFLIGVWLFRIGLRAVFRYGVVGAGALVALLFANMFQSNWMWESWFLALAFLYASVYAPMIEEARA
jgi:hypothetical protein